MENVYLYYRLPKLPLPYFLMSFLPNTFFTYTFYVYLYYRVSFLPIPYLHYTGNHIPTQKPYRPIVKTPGLVYYVDL